MLKIMAKRLDGEKVNARNIAGSNLSNVNLAVHQQRSEMMLPGDREDDVVMFGPDRKPILKSGKRGKTQNLMAATSSNLSQSSFNNTGKHWHKKDPKVDRA